MLVSNVDEYSIQLREGSLSCSGHAGGDSPCDCVCPPFIRLSAGFASCARHSRDATPGDCLRAEEGTVFIINE